MSKTALFIVLMTALLAAGCSAPTSDTILYTPPALGNEWDVWMMQSGGIMGMMRSVQVFSDGVYTVTDSRTDRTITSSLANTEIVGLQGMITEADFIIPKPSGVCADCFVYNLESEWEGKKVVVELDDLSLPESDLEPLVTYLRNLMDSTLN